ncbi:MAG: hypothetical protein IH616_05325, partial [Gemmatimonadales bacterium]|nr:hypothetical protein [Gemmatimonadales bacterium]
MSTYDPRIDRALETFEQEEIPETLPEALPLLDVMRKRFPEPSAFEDVDVLFIQHHLGPFTVRLKAMREDGLDMGRAWFIDIPYSTSQKAREAAHLGSPAAHRVELFEDPLEPYAEAQLARALMLIRELGSRDRGRLLVVDDGAYFLRSLHLLQVTRPDLARAFTGTRVVEQTTRGHRVVERSAALITALELSVVSIARCDTKLKFESPFIGAAVSRAIARAVAASADLTDGFRRAAVLGFGPVGEAVTGALLRAHPSLRIDVVDPDATKHPRIGAQGATPLTELPDRLPERDRYDLVAGCTGYNAFKLHQRFLLAKKAVLASGSSAAIEFNRAEFIELADAYPDDEIEVLDRDTVTKDGIHATIAMR